MNMIRWHQYLLKNCPVGLYKLTTTYAGDNYYKDVSSISTFAVTLDVQLPTIQARSNATINVQLPKNATGTVDVTVNGKTYNAKVGTGELATVTTDKLSEGIFKVYTYYSGDDYYSSCTSNNILIVSKIITY